MEMEEMCDPVSCTLLPCNRPRLCWWLDCVLARCATRKFSQSQWDHSDFIRRATVVEFIFFPQKIRRSELPVEECVTKFCDAVAVMPEATWLSASPKHKVCGQAASFYHLGRTKIEGNKVGTRHVWLAPSGCSWRWWRVARMSLWALPLVRAS